MVGVEIADAFDAYLYLGPRDFLSREKIPSDILDDQPYIEELNKRPWPFRPVNVEAVRKSDPHPRFYVSTPQSRTPDAQMPLANFVGAYTSESEAIVITIDIHQGKLIVKMPMFPQGLALSSASDHRFRIDGLSDAVFLDFDISNEKVTGLTLVRGEGKPKLKLRWNP